MSTSYYALRAPVALVMSWSTRTTMHDLFRAVAPGEHAWVGCVDSSTLHLVADRDVQVAHRGNAGDIVVTHPGPDDMQAISERGDLVTLGQLRRGEAP